VWSIATALLSLGAIVAVRAEPLGFDAEGRGDAVSA
jgi:hypothetical protein